MKNLKLNNSTLKGKLKTKSLSIGSWLTIPSQSIIEILATAGFEWLVIDLEHSPISIESTLNLIGHIQGNDMQALVRVSKNEEVIIKRVLDAGADGIIVPMINSKSDIELTVDYVKYPPVGKRGVGLNRAQKFGTKFNEYVNWLNKEVVIIAQIEHIDGVNNLDEILSNSHLDGIIVGPYDLSASLGFPGDYNNKSVQNAINTIEKKTKKTKKTLGFHVIESDHNHSLKKINAGYNFMAFSIDFFFLGDMARKEMKNLKQKLK